MSESVHEKIFSLLHQLRFFYLSYHVVLFAIYFLCPDASCEERRAALASWQAQLTLSTENDLKK